MLRREGDALGALALVCIDNPMVPGTGHRICNDCMKACIFQTQDPVDIPQAETGVLTDVLAMPWGFEIWSLLTRWNPLNAARPYALPYNGKNVLVVGLGPAGYTLAHHLLNEGFGVVAIDGLKIEPLPEELTGTETRAPKLIRDAKTLFRPLDERTLTGFGGVSEYGITVRWDKNFLDLLYLNLARRRTLRIYGGHSLRRHAHARAGLRPRVRPRRDRRRRRQADARGDDEQPHPRRADGLRLPHGAAAHRGLQEGRAHEPAHRRADPRHRRRPDGDRHGHRGAGLLRAPRREGPRAFRGARRREGRGRRPGRTLRRGAGAARPPARARARDPPGARARDARRRDAGLRAAREALGRLAHRLPALDGGVPGLPPEPRGDRQGARGRNRLRREPRARRGAAGRRRRASCRGLQAEGRIHRRASLPHASRRGGHVAERDVRPGAAREHPARREEQVLPPARRREGRRGLPSRPEGRRGRRVLHRHGVPGASSFRTSATTTPSTPARS